MNDITQLLSALEQGDALAAEQLLPIVYEELRRLAAVKLAHEPSGQTLQPTALVHEVYLRLLGEAHWQGRGHFFAAAAEAMRRILIENARRKKRLRHGGALVRRELPEVAAPEKDDELLAVDEALTRLAVEDAEAARLVTLRFYGGLSMEEAAEVMGISRASAYRHWSYARAWIRCALGEEKSGNC